MSNLPNLNAALNIAGSYVQATWQQAVMGAQPLPGVPEIKANVGLRKAYADSIVLGQRVQGGADLRQFIIATSQAAKDLEYGKAKWDMKPMLLGGPKARIGKKGRYNIIPFRHGTTANHAPNSNFPTMPRDILAQVTKLKPGGRLTGTEGRHPAGQNASTGYQHKNGKYEGMKKVTKTYQGATQSKYLTFRVVSDNSDPGSWWHPGYKAHHIAEKVASYCQPAVEAMLREAAIKDLVPTATVGMDVTFTG
jgi:hypothetical protein